jgi:dihydroorotase-like cyclic amidohydrolase
MPDPPLDLVIKHVRVVRPRRPAIEALDLGVKDGRFARLAPEIPTADAPRAMAGVFPHIDFRREVTVGHLLLDVDAPSGAYAGLLDKGDIDVGYDADLALLDPDHRFVVRATESPSAQGYTPFEGQELTGWVTATFLRGALAWENGAVVGPARGRYVARPSGARRAP